VVTEPGRAGQGQGLAAGDPGVVTWAGSLGVAGRGALISTGVAGRGALVSDPERPCQPWQLVAVTSLPRIRRPPITAAAHPPAGPGSAT
jgi:hypothetical protein